MTPARPGETAQEQFRREFWEEAWKSLEPEHPRDPIFHVGCGTLLLAGCVGTPAGYLIARDSIAHNAGPFGAVVGFIAVMLGLGFLARRRQKGLRLGLGRAVGALLRDRVVWAFTLTTAGAAALYGVSYAAEAEVPAAVGAAALGMVGFTAGFLLGAVVYLVRRAARRRSGRPDMKRRKPTGPEAIRAEMAREFLTLMQSELDERKLGRVRRERLAREVVAAVEANATDKSRDALISALRREVARLASAP